jgi:hypothetical protein
MCNIKDEEYGPRLDCCTEADKWLFGVTGVWVMGNKDP